jgi:hypothetical protein
MNLIELNAIKEHLSKQLAELNAIGVNCINCTEYDQGQCKQYQAQPPQDWLHGSVDCEYWESDNIPF